MEEDFLYERNAREHLSVVNEVSLDQHDFLRGLDEEERGQFREGTWRGRSYPEARRSAARVRRQTECGYLCAGA